MTEAPDANLPPGATRIPNAGRPADAPGVLAEQAAAGSKRDANAAKALPELYKQLDAARTIVKRLESTDAGHVNVHQIHVNIAGEDHVYQPFDKPALAAMLLNDAKARMADVEGKIKALGFEA